MERSSLSVGARGSRLLAGALLLATGVQVALALAGLPGWPCPVRQGLGIPCPGCGLTRGLSALLSGDWSVALRWHPLAPLALVGTALAAAAAGAPPRLSDRIIRGAEGLAARKGIVVLAVTVLLLSWLLRFFPYA